MQTCTTIADLRAAVRAQKDAGQSIAFVPTMGNLHEGHLDLVRRAREISSCVVASIFVNPLQFGPQEDLASYPRTLEADQISLAAEGVALLFTPTVEEMYPQGQESQTIVSVPNLADMLCGAHRPGHFTGVTTVVSKLFNIVAPDYAVFGEKDFQQLTIIRRMCLDLSLPVEIVGVPTARAADGLALSSRNNYLGADERNIAPTLRATLLELKDKLAQRLETIEALEKEGEASLTRAGFKPDYLAIRDAQTLGTVGENSGEAVVLAAALLGKTRLIDNVTVVLAKSET
ncbi:MAG: pantoate--beta-alanine ligase [Pseudomonadales bacterium]